MIQRKYILLGVGIGAVILGLLIFLNLRTYGWLALSTPATARGEISITMERDTDTKPRTLKMSAGKTDKVFIKKGTWRVSAAFDGTSSVDITTVESFKTTKLVLTGGSQRAIAKQASNAEYCPLVQEQTVFSYDCHGTGPVFRHLPLSSNRLDSRQSLFGGDALSWTAPLQGGLLSAHPDSEGGAAQNMALSFIDPLRQTEEKLTLPASIQDLLVTQRPDLIVSQQSTATHFGLFFPNTQTLYIFKNIRDTTPVEIKVDSQRDETKITLINLFADRLSIYRGAGDDPEDGAEGETKKTAPIPASTIRTYDLAGKLLETIQTPKGFTAQGVYALPENFYAVQRSNGLEMRHYKNGQFKLIYLLKDAADPTLVGNSLFIRIADKLYVFEPKPNGLFHMSSVFSSPAIVVSELFESNGKLLFTGLADRAETPPLDIYELLDTPQVTRPFEEIMAFSKVSRFMSSYDYDANQVICSLLFTGTGTYDELVTNLKKNLTSLGIDVGNRAVKLSPLN